MRNVAVPQSRTLCSLYPPMPLPMITSLTAVLLASVGVAQEAFDLERLIEQGRVEELVQIATENPFPLGTSRILRRIGEG